MSETLFKFLLSKISTVRVHCRNQVCGGVVEIPIDKLGAMYRTCSCPLCHQMFDDGQTQVGHLGPLNGRDLFVVFASMLTRLNAIKDKVEIEFVLPDPDEEKSC